MTTTVRHTTPQATPVEAPTERRHPHTDDLDLLPTSELLRVINEEDALVAPAVAQALPAVEAAVELAVAALRDGGTVHYFGAGTSGRIAAMDAAELPPTFGIDAGLVVAHHAGGAAALDTALENVEDDRSRGAADADVLTGRDVAIGLTASGRTPYVAGALAHAGRVGAPTVLVSSHPEAELASLADVHVCVDTGPEVLTGSTRMKAGTAQKPVLNAFSTAVMVRLGRTYSNLMTGVVAKNAKLHGRTVVILAQASGYDLDTCAAVLDECDGDLGVAMVRLLGDVEPDRARAALDASGGVVRAALRHLDAHPDAHSDDPGRSTLTTP